MTSLLDVGTEKHNGIPDAPLVQRGAGVAAPAPVGADAANPLGVLALGGKATDVLLQVCGLRAARFGDYLDVMVPMAVDTDAGSLARLPAGLQVRLGEETSAPDLARLMMTAPMFEFISRRVLARLLVKSGRLTALGSNQVPAAPLGLALFEHRNVYLAVENFVQRLRDLSSSSRYPHVSGRGAAVVLASDDGAVGRGLSRHVTRLVRRAMDRSGADFTLFHVALWGSNFGMSLPDPIGAAASELGGAVETALEATGELTLPLEIDLDQQASSFAADFNIVLSGHAFQGDEGLWKAHAARAVDLLATPAGEKIAAIWRNA